MVDRWMKIYSTNIVNGEGNVNARQDSSKREREGKNKNKKEKNIFIKVEESKKSCVQT